MNTQNVSKLHDTNEFIELVNPKLQPGRAVLWNNLLMKYKEILKYNESEEFNSYTTKKLKNRLTNY